MAEKTVKCVVKVKRFCLPLNFELGNFQSWHTFYATMLKLKLSMACKNFQKAIREVELDGTLSQFKRFTMSKLSFLASGKKILRLVGWKW